MYSTDSGNKYKFADMCSGVALKNEIIYLPAIGEEPDWGFMEKYIKTFPFVDMIWKNALGKNASDILKAAEHK